MILISFLIYLLGYISLIENGKRKPSPIILKKLSSLYKLDYIDLLQKAGFIDFAEKIGKININICQEIKNQYGENAIQLLNNYNKLNNLGKQKIEEFAEDCTSITKYTEK